MAGVLAVSRPLRTTPEQQQHPHRQIEGGNHTIGLQIEVDFVLGCNQND
jgi:hypothetical protein